ncbi:MAG: hypothetical protein LBU25_08830 [Treponema sp.]|jgi:Rad3-related DNA helicase|nr:hypothetical protein [Treponema sp.]
MGTIQETVTPPLGEGLTFEKVWAALMELRESQKESHQEIDRILRETAEQMQETDRQIQGMGAETDRRLQETAEQIQETAEQMKETAKQMQETDRRMKETDKRVGEITHRFGDMVEHMVVPNLVAKFRELGFTFIKAGPNVKVADREHHIFTEVDAFLENGDKVMIVEIKTKPTTDDIKDHRERMKKLRVFADLHDDKRKYLGAVAGVVFDESVKNYALQNGFYVLEPSGETFIITEPRAKGYAPREW